MIGYLIGYPIGTPNRGANRGGTNPPTRPDPTHYLRVTGSSCVPKTESEVTVTYPTTAVGFGFIR